MIKIFIGGFPLEMSELELVKLVSIHGEVDTIKIVRDKKTKICKGYAFLEMKTLQDAENAVIELDGTEISGRMLSVKIRDENAITPAPKSFSRGPKTGGYIKTDRPTDEAKKKRPRKLI